MILQCDQCSTKFRLDDSKLKPGGVKVRCSKCRHVFLAGAELKQEDSEFDAILSGLGAPAMEKQELPASDQEAAGSAFAEESVAVVEKPAAGLEEPAPAAYQPEVSDFADFDFPEPGDPQLQPAAEQQSMPQEQADLGAFDFASEPSLQPDPQPSAVADVPDYGDFSFADEPAALQEEPLPAKDEPFEFGELSFSAEPAAMPEESPSAAPVEGLDFGDFEFSEEPAVKPQEPPPAALDAMDFGDFAFTEEPTVKEEEPPPFAKDAIDFGEISFAEEAPFTKEESAADTSDDFGEFTFGDELEQKQDEQLAPAADSPDFGVFSRPDDVSTKGAPPVAPQAGIAVVAGMAGPAAAEPSDTVAPLLTPGRDGKSAPGPMLDFGFGAAVPDKAQESSEPEEELPSLSITSRRKGRSLLTGSIVAVSVVAIVALTGAGLYLLQSGPEAPKKLEQVGLGFVANWFGVESPQEGRITVRNPLAAFHNNAEAGELFVVTGEAVNSYQKARASIQVKVSLFDNTGKVLVQKTAYCGNRLSDEQLATLPMEKIESIMNNQFGDSLANLGVKPEQAIGFVVAISQVPPNAVDFAVEVVGSTVAGQ